jgi:fibronectin-binding autotransporter adhesin
MPNVFKETSGTNLNDPASWVGGLPLSTDVATWRTGSLGGALTLSANLNLGGTAGGFRVEAATAAITITGVSRTLTIGTAGLVILSGGVDVTLSQTTTTIAGIQTWTIDGSRTLTLNSGFTTSTTAWSRNGTGTLVFNGAVGGAIATPFNLNAGLTQINSTFASTGLISVGNSTVAGDVAIVEVYGTLTPNRGAATGLQIGGNETTGTTFPTSILRLKTGGSITTFSGSIVRVGGTATTTGGGTAYAAYIQEGGALISGGLLLVGTGATSAQRTVTLAEIQGGTVQVGTATGSIDFYVGHAGRTASSLSVLHVTGGSTISSEIRVGSSGSAIVTVKDSGTVASSASVIMATATTASYSVLNVLSGGTLRATIISTGAATSVANVNFNGGVFNTIATGGTLLDSEIDYAHIYQNGLELNSTAILASATGFLTIAAPLRAPSGKGVSSITWTGGTGLGYKAPPVVEISAPPAGGTYATAVAVLDSSGNLTGFTVTNSGTGYVTAPTVTLYGGAPTTPATGVIASIANNAASGDLIVNASGTGNFRIAATATAATNTFNGNITVYDGQFGSGGGLEALASGVQYNLQNVPTVTLEFDASFAVVAAGDISANSVPHTFVGQGTVYYTQVRSGNFVQFGDLSGMTGTGTIASLLGSGVAYRARDGFDQDVPGFWTYATGDTALYNYASAAFTSLPRQLGYIYSDNDTASPYIEYKYNGTAGLTFPTSLQFFNAETALTYAAVAAITAATSVTLTGTVTNASALTGGVPYPVSLAISAEASATLTMTGDISIADASTNSLDVNTLGRTGTVVLSGNNVYPAFYVNSGKLALASATAGGNYPPSSNTRYIQSGATVELRASTAIPAVILSLGGAGTSSQGALYVATGSYVYTASAFSMASTTTMRVDIGATLTLSASGGITGPSYGLIKTGDGTLVNSTSVSGTVFSGAVSVRSGSMRIESLRDGGLSSHLGQSTNAATNLLLGDTSSGVGGTIDYAGSTAASTNREFRLYPTGGTLTATASSVTWNGNGGAFSTATSLTLATTVNTSTFQGVLSGAVTIKRAGTGTWVIRPLDSIGGPTNNTNSGGATLDGTGTTVLASEADFTVPSLGRILGSGNVLVKTGHTVQTATGTTQFGRARYDGNLTFEAGTTLIIGS